MKKIALFLFIGLLSLIAVGIYCAPPLSDIDRIVGGKEGRYSDIAIMQRIMDKNEFSSLPGGFYEYRHDYKNGGWIQILSTDSHHGGGTIGVLESNGQRHFYFGHVCGLGGEGLPITYGEDRFEPDQSQYPEARTARLEKVK